MPNKIFKPNLNLVTRDNNKAYPDISNKVKATDKGLFYNFNSFTPFTFKTNIMSSLIYRVYNIAGYFIRTAWH